MLIVIFSNLRKDRILLIIALGHRNGLASPPTILAGRSFPENAWNGIAKTFLRTKLW
jgi:hypothetical protein